MLLRLGRLVRYVPVSIVIGFTSGIAVLIAISQLRDWLGLRVLNMPADFFAQFKGLGQNIASFNPYAFSLGLAGLLGLFCGPSCGATDHPCSMRWSCRACAAPSSSAPACRAHRGAGDPHAGGAAGDADPHHRHARSHRITACARVADLLSSLPRHDPNRELMAQGIANFLVPFFGGMPATGTIARTVTSVRSGGTTPVAGMIHAVLLAVIVLAAAPLALHVPLAVLAGILLFVVWNMGEWHEFAKMKNYSTHYRVLMLGTFS